MMKRLVIGVAFLSVGILGGCSNNSTPSAAQQSEASVEARIKPVGEVAMALPSYPPTANGIPSSNAVTSSAPAP